MYVYLLVQKMTGRRDWVIVHAIYEHKRDAIEVCNRWNNKVKKWSDATAKSEPPWKVMKRKVR